ncbi:MAG: alkaline phosphatase D family protein [Candidatus Synoicihabitans palmerolidicus]|nr:alkaline phosphatase D family protein [Candidatus Synoicihabitans palmerolidicus]
MSEDERFQGLVASGETIADSAWAHSVHVEVRGLAPHRWYWYRFVARGEASPVGRLRTTPVAGQVVDRLRCSFASCQKYEVGHYTAHEHMAREDLDVIAHLGDYIYEKGDARDAVRPHGLSEAITLDDYRLRYARYKTDPALQAAHAMAPWLVTWDDHEFSNDYAAFVPQYPERYSLRSSGRGERRPTVPIVNTCRCDPPRDPMARICSFSGGRILADWRSSIFWIHGSIAPTSRATVTRCRRRHPPCSILPEPCSVSASADGSLMAWGSRRRDGTCWRSR